MIDYLKYFFNPAHIFSVRPPAMSQRAIIILAVACGVMLIVGIIAKLATNRTKDGLKIKVFRRLTAWGIAMGIIGYLYVFFAAEGVTILSSRFLLIVWAGIAAIWLVVILRYWFIALPRARAEIDQKRQFNKYLP